jgi:cold shock CspA family protein
MIAKVQSYSELKGYGWLLIDFRTRLFFHIKQWNGNIPPEAGMTVSYDVAPGNREGITQAANVTPVVSDAGGAR